MHQFHPIRSALTLAAVVFTVAMPSLAINPFLRLDYAADPSAHVFGDRLYVYPSHDRRDAKEYDMTDYHVYSTDDMANWQDHGVALDVKDVPWGKSHMWAPDIAFKDGTYYFFFCPRPAAGVDEKRPIGVATGKSPAGPFVSRPTWIKGCSGIDPSCFIDDDGVAYVFWAGAGLEAAKLTPDMTAFDGPKVRIEGYKNFFEGPWVFKRNGTYYLTYPAKMKGGSADGGHGQWYDYMTSDKVLGPYAYKGHFTRSDEGAGNIHGSQVEFQGKWYAFDHDVKLSRGDKKSGFKRSIRVDEMTFAADGSIEELKWTDSGPPQTKAFDPYKQCEAECLAECDKPEGPHAITTQTRPDHGVVLTSLNDGDWARYAGVDFGDKGPRLFTAAANGLAGGTIEVRLDSIDGPMIATSAVNPTGGMAVAKSTRVNPADARGRHDLFLVIRGKPGDETMTLDWFRFAK